MSSRVTVAREAGLNDLYGVALSARTADEDRDRAMASGANDYLCKPVEPAELLDRIKSWVN